MNYHRQFRRIGFHVSSGEGWVWDCLHAFEELGPYRLGDFGCLLEDVLYGRAVRRDMKASKQDGRQTLHTPFRGASAWQAAIMALLWTGTSAVPPQVQSEKTSARVVLGRQDHVSVWALISVLPRFLGSSPCSREPSQLSVHRG